MLGPENPQRARHRQYRWRFAVILYLLTENVDKVVAKAVRAKPMGPVMDMFWGDRIGTIVDPDGNTWMIGTHMSEPTPQEMKKRMMEAVRSQASGTPSGSTAQ